MSQPYRRTVEQLALVASKFWPDDLSEQAAELSIVPKLLETQDIFIHILSIPVHTIEGTFEIVDTSTLPASLFLKHLVVLSDFGGENLKRISAESSRLFPNQTLTYLWEDGAKTYQRTYAFKTYPAKKFSNASLGLIGKRLLGTDKLTDLQKDAVAILLFGASSTDTATANILSKCEIGNYLGQPDKLDHFIRQRYIWVSRINAGAESNSMGQLAQKFVLMENRHRFCIITQPANEGEFSIFLLVRGRGLKQGVLTNQNHAIFIPSPHKLYTSKYCS